MVVWTAESARAWSLLKRRLSVARPLWGLRRFVPNGPVRERRQRFPGSIEEALAAVIAFVAMSAAVVAYAQQAEPETIPQPPASGSDRTPRLQIIRVLQSKDQVQGVAWSPDGRMLASYSNSGGLISLWSVDGTHIRDFERHGTYIENSILFPLGGKQLLMPATIKSREDRKFAFTVWDIDTGTAARGVEGPNKSGIGNEPRAFVLSPDGRIVAAITHEPDGPVMLYSTRDWSILRTISIRAPHPGLTLVGPPPVMPAWPTSVAFMPDSDLLAVGTLTGNVCLLDLRHPETGTDTVSVYTHSVLIDSLAFSPDGRFLATGAGFGATYPVTASPVDKASLKIWRVADHGLVAAYPGLTASIRRLSWSSDGRYLAAAVDSDHTLRVFSPADPTREPAVAAFEGGISSAIFSPDGRMLATAAGHAVTIFEPEP